MKKEQFTDWWKQDKRYLTLVKAVLMALLPVVCCLVRTAAEGRSIVLRQTLPDGKSVV